MPDVFSKAKRSEVMSRIRSRGNKDTELALVRVFRAHGITGWRRQQSIRFNAQRPTSNVERSKLSVGRWTFSFSVRPDFVFARLKLAVFVDGCFWHGCPKHATKPRNNAAFWRKKFSANKARDRLVTQTLRRAGWRVLRIWEHELAKIRLRSTPHPSARDEQSVRRTSSGLRPRGLVRARSLGPLRAFGFTELLSPLPKRLKSPQSGEGHLPGRGGEGARNEARLVTRLRRALA